MSTPRRSHLRVVAINDVYEFDHFPSLATLIREEKASIGKPDGPDTVIATLAGDFVSPSALSAMDKGSGMIKALNAVGIDFACLGNHESDVPHDQLLRRIAECSFPVINSNLPGLVPPVTPGELPHVTLARERTPQYAFVEAGDVTVGLLGLCAILPGMEDVSGFPKACVAAAVPCLAAARSYHEKLVDREATANLILPMTHQALAQDSEMITGDEARFPVVLAGHEHEVFIVESDGKGGLVHAEFPDRWDKKGIPLEAGVVRSPSRVVVKGGYDAKFAMIVDLVWEPSDQAKGFRIPTSIKYRKVLVDNWPKDPEILDLCTKLMVKVNALGRTVLAYKIPRSYLPLSSEGGMQKLCTLHTMLCSIMKDALGVDAVLLNAGAVRLLKSFDPVQGGAADEIPLRNADIAGLLQFPTPIQPIPMNGSELVAALRFSRILSKADPGKWNKGLLHADDGIVFVPGTEMDPDRLEILEVNGKKFDPAEKYRVGVLDGLLRGMDGVKPLADWKDAHPQEYDDTADQTRLGKQLIAEFFAGFWWRLLPSFDQLDVDKSGSISLPELRNAYCDVLCGKYSPDQSRNEQEWSEEQQISIASVVDGMLGVADADKDGRVTREEYESVALSLGTGTKRTMEKFLAAARGEAPPAKSTL
ncbi:Metallo-dependent phosphatase-like protein [Hyaloraphidium curvatum]|nr:Metallo-dependent phosphatase-like protein [Hyaloraphidium curvatum]